MRRYQVQQLTITHKRVEVLRPPDRLEVVVYPGVLCYSQSYTFTIFLQYYIDALSSMSGDTVASKWGVESTYVDIDSKLCPWSLTGKVI